MCEVAERLQFPLVELPWQAPLAEIARQISRRIVNEHRELLAQSLDLHRTLTRAVAEGAPLPAVADLLARLLDCGVTIEDAQARPLAVAPRPASDATSGSRPSHEEMIAVAKRHLRSHGFLDARPREPRATRVGPFLELGGQATCIVAPIVAAREVFGFVWATVTHRPITRLDYLGVEHAATVAALILTRDRAVREAWAHHRRDVLDALLSGETMTQKRWQALAARLERMRLDLQRAYRVLLARGDMFPASFLAQVEERWGALLERGHSGLVGRREGHVVLVADHVLAAEAQAVGEAMIQAAAGEGLIGVGMPAPVAALSRSYAQALEATEVYRRLGRRRGVVDFASLGVLHWLYHMPPALKGENPYLQRLRDAARTHPVLVDTLEVYLDCGANAVQAAERLYLHRSTLLYRLRRLEEILGVSLADPTVRLNLHVALKALRLEG